MLLLMTLPLGSSSNFTLAKKARKCENAKAEEQF